MSILNRTVYYDNTNGRAMFWDWAKVTTTIGSMAEPFTPNLRHTGGDNFDPDDEINRIDEIRALPIDKEQLVLSDDHAMGGVQSPRTGR